MSDLTPKEALDSVLEKLGWMLNDKENDDGIKVDKLLLYTLSLSDREGNIVWSKELEVPAFFDSELWKGDPNAINAFPGLLGMIPDPPDAWWIASETEYEEALRLLEYFMDADNSEAVRCLRDKIMAYEAVHYPPNVDATHE